MSAGETVKIGARLLVRLYPRAWRERYGEELLELLEDSVRLRDVIDVIRGAAREWGNLMTGKNRWNDQAQRTTRALAQAGGAVILFQTLVSPIVAAIIGVLPFGVSSFGMGVLWGFVSSLLQSAVVLGPVALVSVVIPWRDVPLARAAASALGGLVALRIGSHIAWGPAELALILAGVWIGYRTVSTDSGVPQAAAAEI